MVELSPFPLLLSGELPSRLFKINPLYLPGNPVIYPLYMYFICTLYYVTDTVTDRPTPQLNNRKDDTIFS